MAAHCGEFYELSGARVWPRRRSRRNHRGGAHAGRRAGDHRCSRARDAPAHGFRAAEPHDLDAVIASPSGPTSTISTRIRHRYPAPYSSDFSLGLAEYSRTRRDSRAPRQAYQDLAVVLIEREPEEPDVPEVAVLNNLALTAAMKRIGRSLLADPDDAEVKSAGLIGIYTFADCRDAIDFARRFREASARRACGVASASMLDRCWYSISHLEVARSRDRRSTSRRSSRRIRASME